MKDSNFIITIVQFRCQNVITILALAIKTVLRIENIVSCVVPTDKRLCENEGVIFLNYTPRHPSSRPWGGGGRRVGGCARLSLDGSVRGLHNACSRCDILRNHGGPVFFSSRQRQHRGVPGFMSASSALVCRISRMHERVSEWRRITVCDRAYRVPRLAHQHTYIPLQPVNDSSFNGFGVKRGKDL